MYWIRQGNVVEVTHELARVTDLDALHSGEPANRRTFLAGALAAHGLAERLWLHIYGSVSWHWRHKNTWQIVIRGF